MNEAERLHFLTRMHEVFYNYNFSYKGDYYFLSSKNTTEEFNDTQQSIEWNIMTKISSVQEECPFVSVLEQSMVVRGANENIEKYIRRLCEPIFS